ncbi:MAG: T9SS type A sorting domain-containing protein [Chitinophagaceae bacterium]|nr:T9SS type A sorting domain-containing protein [Panacibacter sp.]
MKTPYHSSLICFCLISTSIYAQCTATITGDECAGNLIAVNPGVSGIKEVLWLKNDVPQMIRTTYTSPGTVITADLDIPSGIAFDREGNMYVTEYRKNSVVKFLHGSSKGIVVAGGNGSGPDLNQLNGPEDLQVDSAGNIFIADVYNYRIMRWAPGASCGEIVAGGNGPGAALNQFNWPNALSLDRFGNIYVADVYNNRIVKWKPGAKCGQLVAGSSTGCGSGAGELYHPLGVVVDDSGYLYISDFLNCRIQKWAPGASKGVTVAGITKRPSTEGPDKVMPEELCLDKQGNIFVIDSYSQGVKKWQPGKRNGFTVAGGYGLGYSRYQLYFPRGVCVNSKGEVYVAVGGDGEPGHGVVEVFRETATADTSYFTTAPAYYKAEINAQNGCRGLSTAFKVITTPAKPSPVGGPSKIAPLQNNLQYSVAGKNGNKYHWSLPKGVELVSGQGTATITVNWGNKSGYMSVHALNQCAVSEDRFNYVAVAAQMNNSMPAIGVKAGSEQQPLVFPNPVTDIMNIRCPAAANEKTTVKITDVTGKTVLLQQQLAGKAYSDIQVSMAQWSPGFYMVSVYGEKSGMASFRIMKQ